jgi:hypothetical protein
MVVARRKWRIVEGRGRAEGLRNGRDISRVGDELPGDRCVRRSSHTEVVD